MQIALITLNIVGIWNVVFFDGFYLFIYSFSSMSVSLLSLITLIDKYCMLFSDAAVAARLVQLTFQVIYKKKCTKRFCLVYNSNECSTYTITTYYY